ncbi:MAG: hypothetical protein JRE47_10160 [Deltaproteobacteria bacterium]|nr:hypothetical protein [Deltaproteobacteria bacterium]
MPKCPKCGREIDALKNVEDGSMEYKLALDIAGDMHYEQMEFSGYDNEEFLCPKCEAVLFTDPDEAIEFLKGE